MQKDADDPAAMDTSNCLSYNSAEDGQINVAEQDDSSDEYRSFDSLHKRLSSQGSVESDDNNSKEDANFLSGMGSCFSPSKEPLAINFLQQIIYLEQKLSNLEKTLAILTNCGQVNQDSKFPRVFKENHDHMDFMQKINHLSSLTASLKYDFQLMKNKCNFQKTKLNKQLLKIFYLSMQVRVAQDQFYELSNCE